MLRTRVALAGAAIVLAALLGWAFHDALALSAVKAFATGYGYRLAFAHFHVGFSRAKLEGVHAWNLRGEPVFAAQQIDLQYSLRDLLPGGDRRFGLANVDVQRPELTLIHHPDGTYNVTIPQIASARKQQATPLDMRIRIRDGSVAMIDRYAAYPQVRRQRIEGIAFDAVLSPKERSYYTASLDLNDGHRLYPVRGEARFDDARGYESQRWTAAQIPIGPLVDFALSSHAVNLTAGDLYGVELRVFSLADAQGAMHGHLTARALLRDAKIYFAGIEKPLRRGTGELYITENAIDVPRLDATIADVPIVAAGGIYDFASPTIRIGAQGFGDLTQLRRVASAAARRPIAGPLAFRLLVEGTLAKPVIFAGFDASRLAYGSFAFSRARGRVAIEGPRIDILGAQFAYGPVQLDARGSLVAKNHLDATIVGSAQGDSDALPYAARIVPHMQLNATAVVAGVDRNLQVDGVVNGVSPNRTLAGIASVAPDGTGSAGPIAIEGPNGESAYVRVALDRPNNVAEVIFNANRFAVPSGALAALPEAGGIVSGRGIAVARGGRLAYLSGDAAIESMHYRGVTLDRALVRGGYAGGQGVATVIADGRMAGAPLAGSTVLTYAGDRLRIADATAMIAGAVGFADGTVSGLRSGAPHYDLAAQLRAGDLAALARTFGLSLPYPEGTLDADVRVRGAGSQANVAGDVRIPEGSINGLAFAGATRFAGDPSQLRGNGNVRVGSSALRFDAGVGPGRLSLNARGNDVNLSDFNDYFDAADTLHGRGHLAVALTRTPDSLVSSGDVAFADLRYKRFPLGNATARWTTNGSTIAGSGFVNGRGGQVRLAGTGSQSSMNVRASARNLDLGVWLPAAGYTAPVVGLVDANVNAQGTLRAPILDATAALRKGIVAGIPIDRFTVAATARGGRARVASAELAIPNLTANASGSFGLTPRSPLDLTARAETPDIGALSKTLGKPYPVGGTLATTLHVTGTPLAPRLEDTLDLAQFRYKNFIVPRAHTELALAGGTLDVRNGVVDLQRGSASFAGTFPLAISGLAFRETAAPVRGRLDARGIELAQFIPLLPDPKKTKLAGTIDGAVGVGGSLEAPLFDGALTLSRGYYSSPQESKPIANATAALQFAGTSATLGALHADVGGGTLDGSGNVRIAGLRDPLHSVAFDVAATAHRAVLDFPAYFKGELDGTLNARQAVGGTPTIAADLALSHARIPFSTILNQTKSHPAGPAPPNVAFDSHFSVGPDVRVQGTGVDVGIAGALAFGGTLAAPSLNGEIASTGGTVDFYRDFTIQRGAATFSGGVVPDLTAVATTYLVDPGAEVRLRITGPATGLNLALSSNPPLDRSQILGLLIGGPNLAGIEGLQTAQGPAQPTLFQGMTNGYINTLFTRNLLEPLSSSLGTALGLQNLQLNYDLAGNEGFSANVRRSLGKNMSLLFATSYGFPSRTTLGVSDRLSNNSSVRATIFNTYGQAGLGYYAPYLVAQPGTNISLQASQPAAGESGFSIQYVRHFK